MFDIERGKEVRAREDQGIVLPVKDELGKVQDGVTVTLVGSYSEKYQKNADAWREKLLETPRDVSNLEANAISTAWGVVAWEGFTAKGDPFPCTTENAVALMVACPWLAHEWSSKVFNHSAFFTKPSTD